MEKITVSYSRCGKNLGATFSDNVPGAVVFTAHTLTDLKKTAKETLEFHIAGMIEDGETIPDWLKNGDYELVYKPIPLC